MTRRPPAQRPGRSKQDYQTPPDFLAAVEVRFGLLRADLAATYHNAAARPYLSIADDALDVETRWTIGDPARRFAWLNPPFADITPWVAKARAEALRGASTLVLIPASLGANWWRDHVHGVAWVLGLNGRLTFVGAADPYPKDCALLVYGPEVIARYDVWSWRA